MGSDQAGIVLSLVLAGEAENPIVNIDCIRELQPMFSGWIPRDYLRQDGIETQLQLA